MENINYFSILKTSQKIFPPNRRIKVRLKKKPLLAFRNIFLEYYIMNKESYSNFEIYITDLSLEIVPLIKISPKKVIREEAITLLMNKRLQINLLFVFDFLKFLD